jgi:hypothetical protein
MSYNGTAARRRQPDGAGLARADLASAPVRRATSFSTRTGDLPHRAAVGQMAMSRGQCAAMIAVSTFVMFVPL